MTFGNKKKQLHTYRIYERIKVQYLLKHKIVSFFFKKLLIMTTYYYALTFFFIKYLKKKIF